MNTQTKNPVFKYYSKEYLGVATLISEECSRQALFDCQLFEVINMYFYLNQIVNFEVIDKLDETINNQMYLDYLSFVSGTPTIIT